MTQEDGGFGRSYDDRQLAESEALVLHALGIEYQLVQDGGGWRLTVPPSDAARAEAALEAQQREQREEAAARIGQVPDRGPSLAGVTMAFALTMMYVAAGGRTSDPSRWFAAGSARAELIVAGEWWRAVTALTLHADIMHLAGNAAASLIFVSAVGRWIGTGTALGLTLLGGTLGNLAVALGYRVNHNSVGASTATFAALGLLGGLQLYRWGKSRSRLARKRRLWSVLAASVGLFAMLGVGERSDVAAHIAGLAFGTALGILAGRLGVERANWVVQTVSAMGAAALVAVSWWLAFAA